MLATRSSRRQRARRERWLSPLLRCPSGDIRWRTFRWRERISWCTANGRLKFKGGWKGKEKWQLAWWSAWKVNEGFSPVKCEPWMVAIRWSVSTALGHGVLRNSSSLRGTISSPSNAIRQSWDASQMAGRSYLQREFSSTMETEMLFDHVGGGEGRQDQRTRLPRQERLFRDWQKSAAESCTRNLKNRKQNFRR